MRLVKLSVQRFQCIESAEVELGPGLNVLYGPNDLGKSSLAWAIRAVLLLQHNSAHHERFVSWYGDGEPRVALTFTDATDRYWRVTKTFGGSAGRSLLETSKDGRTFTADGNARQVDEKLRKLLGWGIQGPGGAGGKRGFPDSFLAQVLLSEQDSVRKVLFDTSLTNDADESGRRRLTEALGALAQDPLFKQILDDAQAKVDRAFTATGRRKKAAGSPFIAVAERINELEREREELEGKVRETALAEARIRELIDRRDVTTRELATARTRLTDLQAWLAVTRRRAELRAALEVEHAKLRDTDGLQRELERTQREADELQHRLELGTTRIDQLEQQLAEGTAARDHARERLDGIAVDDPAAAREQRELDEQRQRLQEQLHDADRAIERATAAKRSALAAAERVATARAALPALTATARDADAALASATDAEGRARHALEAARERLREATSKNKAQARELRRTELENRRLTSTAERTQAQAQLQRATELEAVLARAAEARATCDALAKDRASARTAVATSEQDIAGIDATVQLLQQVERLARLRAARTELAAAAAAAARAAQERALAEARRAEEAALRASLRADLPTAAELAELRHLHDELRVAEARLGGGLSIALKPRRELAFTSSRDGGPGAPTRTAAPVTLSAERSLSLVIDDVLELEITAGELAARTHAADLRARWTAEGAPRLHVLGVNSIDALAALLARADETRRAADELGREAEAAALRAAQPIGADRDALTARIAELEGADQPAVAAKLDQLGKDWERKLAQEATRATADKATLVQQLAIQRQQLTRLETQLESETATTTALIEDAQRRQVELGVAPAAHAADARARLAAAERELQTLEEQLVALARESTGDANAREQLSTCEQALASATQANQAALTRATQAREALIQAHAHADAASRQASEVDDHGAWTSALHAGTPLLIDRWNQALDEAELRQQDLQTQRTELQRRTDAFAQARERAIQAARDAVKKAESELQATQTALADVARAHAAAQAEHTTKRIAAADLKTALASTNVDGTRTAITNLERELAATGPADDVDDAHLRSHEAFTRTLEARLRDEEEDLARARGALEQVGGAIVVERQRELAQAIEREERREREIEVEYDAWKLLVETLRETETTQGAHLGRALAGPVSRRFGELTGGRYGTLELGAHLEASGLQVAGELRDISSLSAGTQDQLATLLRVCVAEQLQSGIVLDDHLSQSDPKRVAWFNSVLRAAAHQIQIVLITCRPLEVLTESEMPVRPEHMKSSAAGTVRAIDLTQIIKRFAPDAEQVRGSQPSTATAVTSRPRSRTDRTP